MSTSPLTNASIYLIETGFNLYIMIILLRLLLQYFRADFYNPVSQFIVQSTNKLLVPLRRLVPAYGNIDTSALVLALLLKVIELFLLYILEASGVPNTIGLLVWSIGEILRQTIDIFFYATILLFISSWLTPSNNHPVISLLVQLTDPLFFLTRRVFPPKGNIDFSPLFIVIALQIAKIIAVNPIVYIGQKLAGA